MINTGVKILGLMLFILLYDSISAAASSDPDKSLSSDSWAIDVFSNYGSVISDKVSILKDLALYIKGSTDHLEKYQFGVQLLSSLKDELDWPIALGGGGASKLFFNLLESYYKKNGEDQKVIYRTIPSRNIEYYAVPGSYIFVYRSISAPGFDGTGTYYIVTRSPDIWRASFSIQQPRNNYTVSNFGVDKRYSQDILEVIGSTGIEGIFVKENWTTYSHLISIFAKKLY